MSKFMLGPCAVVLSLLLLGVAGCGPDKTSQEYFQLAKAAYEKNAYRDAIVHLKNALVKNPANVDARLLLGMLHNRRTDGAAAEPELRRAIQLGAISGEAYGELGRALVLDRQYKKVLDEIKLTPEMKGAGAALILSVRGDAYLSLGQRKEAKAAYDDALKFQPEFPEAVLGQGRIKLVEGDADAALAIVDRVTTASPQVIEAWFLKGDILRSQSKQEDAIAAYGKALEILPTHIHTRLNRALLLISVGKLDAAQKDVDAVRSVAKRQPMANYAQALIHLRAGRQTRAQESILEVLKALPDYPPALLLAGSINHSTGSFEQAGRQLGRFVKLYPGNIYARKLLASSLIEMNQVQRALELIEPMLAQLPKDSSLLALAGVAYMKAGAFDKSSDYFNRAAAVDPKNTAYLTSLGMSRIGQGEVDQGIAALEQAASLQSGRPRAAYFLVTTHLVRKDYDKALAAALDLAKKQANDPVTQMLIGMAYVGKKDSAKAREYFERALSIQAGFFPAAQQLAMLDMQDKKPAAAKKRYEDMLAKDKNNVQAMLALSKLASDSGNAKEVESWLEKARQANPRAWHARVVLVRNLLHSGERRKALSIAQETAAVDPGNPEVLDALGAAQLANGENENARTTFTQLVEVAPKSPHAHFRLASAQASSGAGEKAAAESLKKALALKPNYMEAKTSLALLEARAGRFEESIKLARQLQSTYPQAPYGFELEGDILAQQKKYPQALKLYETALAMEKNGPLLVKISMAQARGGNGAADLGPLLQWVTDNPGDVGTRLFLADTYVRTGKSKAAISHYERVLEQLPENVIALNNLAAAYHQEKDTRAVATAEKAYKLAPANADVADTLGWMLVERGDLARGLELLREAVSREPKSADIHYHYVLALRKSGDRVKARKELEELLAIYRNFRRLDEAKALLKEL